MVMEWRTILNLNLNIPPDEEVTIENLETVRAIGGVYKIYDESNDLVYVGQSKNLARRIKEHFRNKRKGIFIHKVKFFYVHHEDVFVEDSMRDMYETFLIRKLKPKYNKYQTAPMRYITN